jgi:hypothetical protein
MYSSHGLPPELVARIVQTLDVCIRADLQHVRFGYFVWLLIASGVVVVGVAMEGPEVWHETANIFNHRPTETEHKPPNWVKLLATLGWMLIVLGVAGEGIAEAYVSWADSTLQTFNDILLGEAQKEAAFAIERAANANERAGELEQRLADRHITLKQRKKILAILAAHRGTRVSVTYITPSSSDAQEYSIELGEVFRAAKWTVVPYQWLTSMDTPVYGFAVEIREKGALSKRKLLERTIRGALSVLDNRIVVLPTGGHDPGSRMNLDLVVLVGSK